MKKYWIVGNGKSLQQTPPERIHPDEITIATNLIAKRFDDAHPWRPDWYVAVSDGVHHAEYYQYFCRGVIEAKRGAIVSQQNMDILGKLSERVLEINVFDDNKPEWYRGDEYSHCKFAMSHMVSFQLIAGLQHSSEIFLIGFDGNFRPQLEDGTDMCHFTDDYWGKYQQSRPKDPKFWERMNRDHMIAHSFIRSMEEKYDFKIYNCTPNSAYKMYDYMSFEEALDA